MFRRRAIWFGAILVALLVAFFIYQLTSNRHYVSRGPGVGANKVVSQTTPAPLPDKAPPTTAPVRPPIVVRPVTDAPRFNTMQEYRAEIVARPAKQELIELQPAGKTPELEVRRVQSTVRKYRAAFGENPVGSNPEIARALLGKNPSGAKFIDPAAVKLNDKSEWIDDWETAYFFHAVSGSLMEIRSAGPDRKLFSKDDIVR